MCTKLNIQQIEGLIWTMYVHPHMMWVWLCIHVKTLERPVENHQNYIPHSRGASDYFHIVHDVQDREKYQFHPSKCKMWSFEIWVCEWSAPTMESKASGTIVILKSTHSELQGPLQFQDAFFYLNHSIFQVLDIWPRFRTEWPLIAGFSFCTF